MCFWIYQALALGSVNRWPVFLNARGTNHCWFVAVRSGYRSVFCIMSWNVQAICMHKPRNYTLIVLLTVQFRCKVRAVRSENEIHFSKAYMVLFKVTYSVLLLSRRSSNEHDDAITRRAKLVRWRRTAEPVFCRAAGSPSDESRTPCPSESGLLCWFVTLYQLFFNTALLSTFCTCDKN